MDPATAPADSAALVRRLAQRLHARLVETHISWVLLLPDLAYKFKKPVRLPFLDYSTPERRRHFCEEEVRLNRRLAPSLYLGVARLGGTPEEPAFDVPGPVLDYAVRMRRFPDEALLSARAAAGSIDARDTDRLAAHLADFHRGAAPVTQPAGATLQARTLAALEGSAALFDPAEREVLSAWIVQESGRVVPLWRERRAAGHARECHGDLHLANLLELDGAIAAFDCIEFDDDLRCIDVVEDAAFTQMDLAAHGLPAFAARFMNAWLEATGEYEGVPGLRLCLVYRALVRATVHQLRAPGGAEARRYALEALAWSRSAAPRLVITHGLPGSGKTYASQQLLEATGAIRIRSDVERKRLYGLDALADSQASGVAIYTREAGRQTYGRLFTLARMLLAAGWPVVLDAAFLLRGERARARELARELKVPFSILDCDAPLEVLRQRLRLRRSDASEADVAVLEKLRLAAEPLDEEEQAAVLGAD
ncbi:MAG: AAA family ATPase [Burkholderiales bacterium]|nr:AAA family ATPase [Burkholderiales bacterium]